MILQEMLQEQREAGYIEGETKGRVDAILDLLKDLPGEASEDLMEFLSSEKDCNTLRRYLKLAASVASVEEFARQLPN